MIKVLFAVFMVFTLSTGCASTRELKKLVKTPEQNLIMIIGALTTYEELLTMESKLSDEVKAFNREWLEADKIKKEVMTIAANRLNARIKAMNDIKLTLLHAIMEELKRIKAGTEADSKELE